MSLCTQQQFQFAVVSVKVLPPGQRSGSCSAQSHISEESGRPGTLRQENSSDQDWISVNDQTQFVSFN